MDPASASAAAAAARRDDSAPLAGVPPAPASAAGGGDGGASLGGFGQSFAQEVDNATTKWMKMISSTFLGESSGSSIFARRASGSAVGGGSGAPQDALGSLTKLRGENGLDPTPELKIALVGGAAVVRSSALDPGKTSIVRRWMQRSYPSSYAPTIGVDVSSLTYRHRGQELLLHLWDVSSMEADVSASSLHALLCEDLDGIFFVFNVHRVSSIAAIDKWRHSLAKFLSPKEIPCFLLSHKADLLQKRVMTSDDIAAYARRMVELICKERLATEQQRVMRLARPLTTGNPAPLEIIQTDDALHHFSTALLRIPTKAITTLPRDENMLPINEKLDPRAASDEEEHKNATTAQRVENRATNFGGNWILGNNKGVYLRATNRSILANDETDDEADAAEEFTFPFSGSRQINDGAIEEDAAAAAETRRREKEEEDQERRREEEKAEQDRRNDEEAWRFFAGSIDRARTEALLECVLRDALLPANREEGTFLLRRKDAQTLILSYMGSDHVHHVLIEFSNQKYHIGSSKVGCASQATAFATLWRCLRSVRRYAYRGLVFTRNVDFSVVNKQELVLEDETRAPIAGSDATTPSAVPTTPSIWRTRTRSGSSGSMGERSSSSNSRHASPTTAPRKPRLAPGLQANQEQVRVPPQTRVDELSAEFYDHLAERLAHLASQQSAEAPETGRTLLSGRLAALVAQEKRLVRSGDAESQWRQLVKNMEAWNRIVMNLTEGAPLLALDAPGAPTHRRPPPADAPAAADLESGRAAPALAARREAETPGEKSSRAQQQKRRGQLKTKERHSDSAASASVSTSPSAVEKISVAAVVVHLLKGNIGPGAMSLPSGFSKTGIYAGPLVFVLVVRPSPSCLANFAVLSGIAIVFYYSIDYWQHPTVPRESTVFADWSQLPEFYGTAVYSFEGIGLVLPIQNAMAQPERFPRLLAVCMLSILVLFLFIGEVPTIAFGRIDNGSMTAVLHEYCEGWLVTMANVALAFACTLSFPIQFYPAIDVLERMMRHRGSLMRPAPPVEPTDAVLEARRRRKARKSHYRPVRDRESAAGLEYDTDRVEEDHEPQLSSTSTDSSSHPTPISSLQTMRQSFSPMASPALVAAAASVSSSPSSSSWLERLLCNLSPYECNRTLFRSMLCTSLMVVAVCVPDVGLLISLFGSVGSSMLAIVLPPVLYLVVAGSSLSLASRVFHGAIVVVGVVGMVAGTAQALGQVIASFN
ncbi:hypothetical protein BBJ28_00022207 [Nothophytophthora sp. Chile5]|nr:hypothetical protein BBJ28_00022207 [Nothophytophthora sp. Chile5]